MEAGKSQKAISQLSAADNNRCQVSGVRCQKKLVSSASLRPGGPIVGLEAYGLEVLP